MIFNDAHVALACRMLVQLTPDPPWPMKMHKWVPVCILFASFCLHLERQLCHCYCQIADNMSMLTGNELIIWQAFVAPTQSLHQQMGPNVSPSHPFFGIVCLGRPMEIIDMAKKLLTMKRLTLMAILKCACLTTCIQRWGTLTASWQQQSKMKADTTPHLPGNMLMMCSNIWRAKPGTTMTSPLPTQTWLRKFKPNVG